MTLVECPQRLEHLTPIKTGKGVQREFSFTDPNVVRAALEMCQEWETKVVRKGECSTTNYNLRSNGELIAVFVDTPHPFPGLVVFAKNLKLLAVHKNTLFQNIKKHL